MIAVFRQWIRPHGGRWIASLVTVAIIALALAVAGLAQSSTGRHVTRSLGLFAPSEPFTELYFSHPGAVAAVTRNAPAHPRRRERVSFVIRNAGHQAVTYRWSVSVHGSAAAAGTTRLQAGRSAPVDRSVATGCRAPSRSASSAHAGGAHGTFAAKRSHTRRRRRRNAGPRRVRVAGAHGTFAAKRSHTRRRRRRNAGPRRVRVAGAHGTFAAKRSHTRRRRKRNAGPRRVRVTVSLRRPSELIGYWVRCRG